jgi:hypothetical protein
LKLSCCTAASLLQRAGKGGRGGLSARHS